MFGSKPRPPPTLLDRALGSYLGLAVGDALGATVEFLTAREIAAQYGTHRDLIGGGWLRLKPGQVTDDTQMSLALGTSILAARGWNPHTSAAAFVDWMRSKPVDIGNTCRRGIRRYMLDRTLSAGARDDEAGNGAAMRNLPVVLSTLRDDAEFFHRTISQAHLTHWHPYSDAATLALGQMTRRMILGLGKEDAKDMAEALSSLHPVFRYNPWPGNTSGYIVDTTQTVFDAFFATSSFEECLLRVVNRGGDADTTGALAGQLAGALYGVQGIPWRWLRKLDQRVDSAIRSQTMGLLGLSLGGAPSVQALSQQKISVAPIGKFMLCAI